MFGGNAVSDEYHIGRHVANLFVTQTYEGQSDIHCEFHAAITIHSSHMLIQSSSFDNWASHYWHPRIRLRRSMSETFLACRCICGACKKLHGGHVNIASATSRTSVHMKRSFRMHAAAQSHSPTSNSHTRMVRAAMREFCPAAAAAAAATSAIVCNLPLGADNGDSNTTYPVKMDALGHVSLIHSRKATVSLGDYKEFLEARLNSSLPNLGKAVAARPSL